MEVISVGAKNMAKDRHSARPVNHRIEKPLRLTGQIIGVELRQPLVLLDEFQLILLEPPKVVHPYKARAPEYRFHEVLRGDGSK